MVNSIWVVIDEGCQECGVGSELVGSYRTAAEADTASALRDEVTKNWRDGGSTVTNVYEVGIPTSEG